MERLTKREILAGNHVAYITEDDCFDVWSVPKRFMGNAVDRLAEIEDILGDDYDLDHLRALVEADRDGRCVISPVKPGETAWCGFKKYDPVKGTEKNIVYPVVLKGWWTNLKYCEYDYRHFRFGELYSNEKSANDALKREQKKEA